MSLEQGVQVDQEAPAAVDGQKTSPHVREADLSRPESGAHLEKGRRIYVNRTLRMASVEMIGFDMDYTLALYHSERLEALAIQKTVVKLLGLGYPELLANLSYNPSLIIRGLVVDKRHGNLFKMDRHRHVGRVFHGFERLARAKRAELYRKESIRLSAKRYHLVDTLYSLPEAYLFCAIIDLFKKVGRRVSYPKIFDDIRLCIDDAHEDGSINKEIMKNPSYYIARDPDLPMTLHKFRSSGKRLFLMTNSAWAYTDCVMQYLMEGVFPEYSNWKRFFDVIIVGACKPRFFTGQEPFWELDVKGKATTEVRNGLERGKVYQGGCIREFERQAGTGSDRVLYVGDHIYGDVLRAKKASAWRTAMIIQEMEREVAVAEHHRAELRQIAGLEEEIERLELDINYQQTVVKALQKLADGVGNPVGAEISGEPVQGYLEARASLEKLKSRLRKALGEYRRKSKGVDQAFNPLWGPLFKEGSEHSAFGSQVEEYACLYTSRVTNFLLYSPLQFFRAPRELMPHELP